jgi:hypothetical protein
MADHTSGDSVVTVELADRIITEALKRGYKFTVSKKEEGDFPLVDSTDHDAILALVDLDPNTAFIATSPFGREDTGVITFDKNRLAPGFHCSMLNRHLYDLLIEIVNDKL